MDPASDTDNHETFGWSRRAIIGWAIAILLALGGIAIAITQAVDQEELTAFVDYLQSFGSRWWAPLALIAAFVVINLTGIPGTPLTLAAGAVWGWLVGGAWVMAAVVVGTAAPYLLVKHGAPRLRRTIESRFGQLSRRLRGHGLTNVMLLRLVHVFPFAAISYAAGLAGVRLRDYVIGTFVGTLPGVLVYTFLADSILQGLVSPEEATRRIALAAVLLTALAIASRWLANRINKR